MYGTCAYLGMICSLHFVREIGEVLDVKCSVEISLHKRDHTFVQLQRVAKLLTVSKSNARKSILLNNV